MSNEVSVTNTLAFLFPKGAAQPTLEEMARFVKSLNADHADMESAYKISEERSVYVKFKHEAAMKKALLENVAKHFFHYANGKKVEVCMSVAGGNVRYVRIFDLPPEVNDRDISTVLEKFGKVKRLDRETFPVDLGLGDLFTGVRGVHMDIEKEIPPIIRFAGRKGRLYYQQMKPRCYLCLAEGHFKAACPNKKNRQKCAEQSTNSRSYADIAGCASSSCENGEKVECEKENPSHNEESTNATENEATADYPCLDHSTQELEETLTEDELEENIEMDVSKVNKESNEETAWHRLANVINDYKTAKEKDQTRAVEEQRQQRKKSGTRPKTGVVSPPMKKKH